MKRPTASLSCVDQRSRGGDLLAHRSNVDRAAGTTSSMTAWHQADGGGCRTRSRAGLRTVILRWCGSPSGKGRLPTMVTTSSSSGPSVIRYLKPWDEGLREPWL